MSGSLIYVRQSAHITILRLPNLVSEFTCVTALSSLPSTIDGRVLTPGNITYIIKVTSSYCDTIAIGDTLQSYKPIWSQLSTNRFVSPRASESAHSYTHRVCIGSSIAANYRTLNLTTLYGSQIFSIRQLSRFAIYCTEHSAPLRSYESKDLFLPGPRMCGGTNGWFV